MLANTKDLHGNHKIINIKKCLIIKLKLFRCVYVSIDEYLKFNQSCTWYAFIENI